ncbi:MOSC domain-containing protein [Limibaculum sp. M0105]|uniref:MOSC domain-containing protein n=1 Tax=Thermohalobaculum xanthum TaxID=2753746 RepID=A0A8J7MAF5_9RHOB|nr:MOSC domain-containing protein [Thermohalobaculum xanthum]MBK0400449.1 MOSC domain-containing protein [Thermohalobaculum xanthum]
MQPDSPLGALVARIAGPGEVRWIGLRPGRRMPVQAVERAAIALDGLAGDHRASPGKRAVTLIQWEHLPVIAALARHDQVDPALLRRNIAVAGVNLLGLRNRAFRIGTAVLRGSGLCAPCSRMEEVLGPGGYAAVRGHGGITAEVVEPGEMAPGDAVTPV